MRVDERQQLARRVVHFYQNQADRNKFITVNHFKLEGESPSTLYAILKRFDESGTPSFKKKSGRPAKILTPRNENLVRRLFQSKPSTSYATASQKLKINPKTLVHIKVGKLGIRAIRKQSAPKYENDQASRAKTSMRRLADNYLTKARPYKLIIDDESYVPVDPNDIPGRKFYHQGPDYKVDPKEKYVGKNKFFKKYLVWQAIAENGKVSEPVVLLGTMTAERYLEEVIKPVLIPFIDANYKRDEVLFWPDMARAHYTPAIREYLDSVGIRYVTWPENAPKVPQARPIEKFWALCKEKYLKHNVKPKGLVGFRRIWKKISLEVEQSSGLELMRNVRQKIRTIGKKGVYAILK